MPPNICICILQFLNTFQYSRCISTVSEGDEIKMMIAHLQEAWGDSGVTRGCQNQTGLLLLTQSRHCT